MINSVRNTVLAVANKENYGYITPSDFNLYAKQAQLDIFEEYFYRYNEWITKQNARASGSDYANVVKNLEEVIDKFSSVSGGLTYSVDRFELPSDYYLINKVLYSGNKEIERVSDRADHRRQDRRTCPRCDGVSRTVDQGHRRQPPPRRLAARRPDRTVTIMRIVLERSVRRNRGFRFRHFRHRRNPRPDPPRDPLKDHHDHHEGPECRQDRPEVNPHAGIPCTEEQRIEDRDRFTADRMHGASLAPAPRFVAGRPAVGAILHDFA